MFISETAIDNLVLLTTECFTLVPSWKNC